MRSQWTRRIIPRWRSSAVSASLLESVPSQNTKKNNPSNDDGILASLKEQINKWRNEPSLGVAADLLNFSHVPTCKPLLQEPAEYVINHGRNLSPQLYSLANMVLGHSYFSEYEVNNRQRNEIIRLKRQLLLNPRNSIALIDLARNYVILGQNKHAARAIKIAVSLQPDNRFVLRSASRFYIHDGDPERALAILKNSTRTQIDPWLMASMIAIETIQDKSPMFYKKAKGMIDSERFAPLHVSELGSALATLQVNAGQIKNAKRMFNATLNNPNDNAVAQAVWAANEFGMPINIDPQWLSGKFSSEANYYTHDKVGEYKGALKAAQEWFDDEPFSTRPLLAGAFASSILGFYPLAEEQMQQALRLDQYDLEAKNNLAFALLSQNKLPDAYELLTDIVTNENRKDGTLSGHTLANIGMYFYRSGDCDRGRSHYEYAYTFLDGKKELSSKSLAISYWAQEAMLAHDPQIEEIMYKAKMIVDTSNSFAAKIVLSRISGKKIVSKESKSEIFRSAITWEHDKLNNVLILNKREPFGNKIK